jgi:WD40 repeat protein
MSLFTNTRVLKVLPGPVHSVGFAGSGRLLVAGQYWSHQSEELYGPARLVTEGGRCLAQTQGRHSTGYAAVHPSGQRYACSGYHGCTIHDLHSATLRLVRRLCPEHDAVNCVLYTPDGRWLVGGGQSYDPETDRPLLRWDTTDWVPSPLPGFARSVSCLAISPDGRTLLVGGSEGVVQVRDLRTWEVIGDWQAPRADPDNRHPLVNAAQLSLDGGMLYAAFARRPYLRAFRLPGFRSGPPFEQESEVHALVVLADGTLVSGDSFGDVTFWDGGSATVRDRYNARGRRQLVTDVPRDGSQEEDTEAGSVSSLAVSPDGKRLAVGDGIGESSGRVHLLDLTL